MGKLRSLPVIFLLILTTNALLPLLSLVLNIVHDVSYFDKFKAETINELPQLIEQAKWQFEQRGQGELESFLNNKYNLRKINFYLLRGTDGQVAAFKNPQNKVDDIDVEFQPSEKPSQTESAIFHTAELNNGSKLTIGTNKDVLSYLISSFESKKITLIGYFVTLILSTSLLFWYFLRFLPILQKQILSGHKNFTAKTSASQEEQFLWQFLQSTDKTKAALKQNLSYAQLHLPPTVLHEISIDRQEQYSFGCVAVKLDLNNSVTLGQKYTEAIVKEEVHKYFFEAKLIIEFFGGLLHYPEGDALIFYFKKDEHRLPHVAALGCVRLLYQTAKSYSQRTKVTRGFEMTFKASIADSSLDVQPSATLDAKGTPLLINGAAFGKTARMLTLFTKEDKLINTAIVDKRVFETTSQAAKFVELGTKSLEGFLAEETFYKLIDLNPMIEALDKPYILAYKSQDELEIALKHLNKKETKDSLQLFTQTLSYIADRNSTPYTSASSVVAAYANLLSSVSEEYASGIYADDVRGERLSRLISSAKHLLTAKSLTAQLNNLFMRSLESPFPRVVANAIEAISYFDIADDRKLLKRLAKSPSNRVRANAIAFLAVNFTDQEYTNLKEMLSSNNPLFRSSGCFSVGMIYKRYQEIDPGFININKNLQELAATVESLVADDDPMVKRQAEIAKSIIKEI